MASAGARAYNGVWGATSGRPGAESPVEDQGLSIGTMTFDLG